MIRKHPSLILLAAVAIGIAGADYFRTPAWLFLLLSLVLLLTAFYALATRSPRLATVMFTLTIGSFSAFHYAIDHYDLGLTHIGGFIEPSQRYHLIGEVADWPRLRPNRTELIVELDSLAVGYHFRPARGRVMLRLSSPTTSIQRGDRLEFFGYIYPVHERPDPAGFDYGRYLRLDRVFGTVYLPTELHVRIERRSHIGLFAVVDNIRDAIRTSFQDNLSPIAAALASGFLIGETRDIPPEIYTLFRDTGTLHVLAVSGSNVALVVAFVLAMLWVFRPGRNRRYLLLLLAIGLFALLSYEEPSVLRASLMAALVILARWSGRHFDLNNIIALAALIILLVAPAQLFDVGFQLSFVIAWGLILTTSRMLNLLPESIKHGRRWLFWLAMTLTVTITAQIFATPLMLFYFGRVPLMSVFANLIAVPMVSIGVWAMLITLVCDLIWPALGLLAGALTTLWLEGIIDTLWLFITERDTMWQVASVHWFAVILAYAACVAAILAINRPRFRRSLVIALLVALNTLLVVRVVATLRPAPQAELLVFRLPGGIGGLLIDHHTRQADLIVTGLYGRDYPIDERIILPILENHAIDSLHRIFILSADYAALEDLLRLADRSSTDSVLLHPRLLPSAQDLRLQKALGDNLSDLAVWSGQPARPAAEGYYPSGNRLDIVIADRKITFLADLHPLPETLPQSELIILGARLNPAEHSAVLDALHSGHTLVCARFEQHPDTADVLKDSRPTIIDLTRDGYGRFSLDNNRDRLAPIPD
jgi:ComEC/Rec2-related protein